MHVPGAAAAAGCWHGNLITPRIALPRFFAPTHAPNKLRQHTKRREESKAATAAAAAAARRGGGPAWFGASRRALRWARWGLGRSGLSLCDGCWYGGVDLSVFIWIRLCVRARMRVFYVNRAYQLDNENSPVVAGKTTQSALRTNLAPRRKPTPSPACFSFC